MNLKHPAFFDGVVLIEPEKHHDVGKAVQTQKGIRVVVKNFDANDSVRFSNNADGKNVKGQS